MGARLADIVAHIDNVRQLEAVVTAMRGIAAGRTQRSRGLLAGIESYAQIVAHAIGDALRGAPSYQVPKKADGRGALIIFCSEGGFCGALSDRVFDAIGDTWNDSVVFEIGSRGATIAEERGIRLDWTTSMANQIGTVPAVADRIARALYAGIDSGRLLRAEVIYPCIGGTGSAIRIERVSLLPLDMERFKVDKSEEPPLVNLGWDVLLERLAAEYVYALLVRAAMQAFAAESQARMTAMASALTNIEKTLSELQLREHMTRQEEVTSEIVELTSSVLSI